MSNEEVVELYDDNEDDTADDYDEPDLEFDVAEIEEIENPIDRATAAEEKLNG